MSASHLVQTTSLRTTSFEELQYAAKDWDQQYFQMSPGRFEGCLELTQIGSRQVMRERWSRKIRYRGTAPPQAFGFALGLDLPGTANWVGKSVGPDTVIMQAPGREADFVSSDYWDALVLGVSEKEVQSVVLAFSGHGELGNNVHGTVTLKQKVANRLKGIGLDFIRQSKLMTVRDEEEISRYSKQFVNLFLWEVLKAQDRSDFAIESSRPATTVKRATELVYSDPTSGIGLTEICTRLNISLRTLHYAFQDVTGMSPATWLRRVRLNQVHTILMKSSPDEILIKQVALEKGFFHLGHFSKQYKRLFGCLPMETLQSS